MPKLPKKNSSSTQRGKSNMAKMQNNLSTFLASTRTTQDSRKNLRRKEEQVLKRKIAYIDLSKRKTATKDIPQKIRRLYLGGRGIDAKRGRVIKCELCGGDPVCVKFCRPEALQYVPVTRVNLMKQRAAAKRFSELIEKMLAPP